MDPVAVHLLDSESQATTLPTIFGEHMDPAAVHLLDSESQATTLPTIFGEHMDPVAVHLLDSESQATTRLAESSYRARFLRDVRIPGRTGK
jgi:hypothetical protein